MKHPASTVKAADGHGSDNGRKSSRYNTRGSVLNFEEATETRFDHRGNSRSRSPTPSNPPLSTPQIPKTKASYGMFGGQFKARPARTLRQRVQRKQVVRDSVVPESESETHTEQVVEESRQDDSIQEEPLLVSQEADTSRRTRSDRKAGSEDGNIDVATLESPISHTDDRVSKSGPASSSHQLSLDESENIRGHLLIAYLMEDRKQKQEQYVINFRKRSIEESDKRLSNLCKTLEDIKRQVAEEEAVGKGHRKVLEDTEGDMTERTKRMKKLRKDVTGDEGFELAMRLMRGA